jgi:hypothetical protein
LQEISCNNTFCPPKIRVLSASIHPVYADRRASTSEFRLKGEIPAGAVPEM